jgi:hypothetical protein
VLTRYHVVVQRIGFEDSVHAEVLTLDELASLVAMVRVGSYVGVYEGVEPVAHFRVDVVTSKRAERIALGRGRKAA